VGGGALALAAGALVLGAGGPGAAWGAAGPGGAGAGGALLELAAAGGRAPAAPPGLPRRRMDRTLATLLLRSGFESLAEARFVPMDVFQKTQFLRRQAAQEAYLAAAKPMGIGVDVGNVADPQYFDLIAFVQWSTASELLTSGAARQEFEEFCEECEGRARLVRRPVGLEDDARVPAFVQGRAADLVYARLRDGFEGEEFAGVPAPLPPGAPLEDVVAGARGVLGALVERGYALSADARAEEGARGGFRVALQAPATLWGLQRLAASPAAARAAGLPAHDALAVGGFLRASGLAPHCLIRAGPGGVEEEWQL